MTYLVSCIECGHYPVSTNAVRCPKCSKNPYGQTCSICKLKVADSKKIECKKYNEKDNFYYHPECIEKVNKVNHKCPACSYVNTQYTGCCRNCGHGFKGFMCSYCGLSGLLDVAEFHWYHPICANKIRPELEARASEKKELARKEAEQKIIEARNQEKIKADNLIREEKRKRDREVQKIEEKEKLIAQLWSEWWYDHWFIIVIIIFLAVLGVACWETFSMIISFISLLLIPSLIGSLVQSIYNLQQEIDNAIRQCDRRY